MDFSKVCSLCGKDAAVRNYERTEVLLINCLSCGEYKITRECRDDLPAERKLRDQLIKVSTFTRYRTIHKEPVVTLFFGDPKGFSEGYSITQIIGMFPSLPDRKLMALSNLQGLSKYWGDSVSIDRNDIPVFFPEVREEQPSLMMMKSLIDEGLVSGEVKFPTQLVVTDKGASLLSAKANPAPQAPVVPPKPTVPTDKLDGLHPKVLAVAKGYYESGHYRAAVLDTYVALDNEVKQRSGLADNGTSLMNTAFSANNPVLKVPIGQDQKGAMWLFAGAMMGVRNFLAHNQTAQPSEQEALEWLHFASALYRILDSTTI